ncbi:hypothetical protein TSUD_306540 [Trifolium subterraneum]|uniref:Uncharacterized protein n=1 Tax=Trifolium subterraneum TaxID=3900 RepID=A0A2Z6P061_TRISU|nr:hypothetical protein TSUD_306540 [Trifolium subterraneum]
MANSDDESLSLDNYGGASNIGSKVGGSVGVVSKPLDDSNGGGYASHHGNGDSKF